MLVKKNETRDFSVSKIRDWVISELPLPLPIVSKMYKSFIEWDLLRVCHMPDVADGNEREQIERKDKLLKMLRGE